MPLRRPRTTALLLRSPAAAFSNAVTFGASPPAAVGARYQANLTFVAPSELCTAQVGLHLGSGCVCYARHCGPTCKLARMQPNLAALCLT